MTAQIIAGGSHPWHGGIRPVDLVWLSEGITTSLVLGMPEDARSVAWETTEGRIFDDAILMLALLGVGDPALRARAEKEAPVLLADGPLRRPELDDDGVRALVTPAIDLVARVSKLVVTLLPGSTLASEGDRIRQHPGDIEVFTAADADEETAGTATDVQEPLPQPAPVDPGWVRSRLALSTAALEELRDAGVLRSRNSPPGDYAEWLVARCTDGKLAPPSQPSWDVLTPDGERLQVKARVLSDPPTAGQRQLSSFRSWDFDACVVVLFEEDFRIGSATRLPRDVVEAASSSDAHVGGRRVMANAKLLQDPQADDWTTLLRAAAGS